MSTQTIETSFKHKFQSKIEIMIMCGLFIILALAVYLTSDSGGKVPTGYSNLVGLSLEETKQKANFAIPLINELPFSITKEEGTINITEYGQEKVHRVSLHYLNEKTAQELYIVFSKLDKDLQDYEKLETEIVKLPNGKDAKYGIVEYGEGLTWIQDGVFYGVYNHINKKQPTLGVNNLMDIAEKISNN
ncbi:hypothetical protein ACFSO7_11620 [Bacillus sp. CGMCC 1.16607]|uniref:hypothetical protein n=1 Tax=Bacillus sp. CGMCC 1.16607 TaxID=3351842 RepID=UPI00362E4CEF